MALDADITSSVMNSYVTEAEAITYFADRGHGETWDDVISPDGFLISATNQIDWFMNFKGEKVAADQPLQWPRNYVYNDNGTAYLSITEIPTRLKQAVFELAIQSIDEDRLLDSDMAGLQEVKVGSLKIVANMVGPWQEKKRAMPSIIYRILGPLITSSSTMFRRAERA